MNKPYMTTPIYDFVEEYNSKKSARFHMPGHKGQRILGCENADITEISGADSLYEASGIIAQSEKNASMLFGSKSTFYSAEGSSLCIRAMLYLAKLAEEKKQELRTTVVAGRNAHKTFVLSAALLDFDVEWLYPTDNESVCSCEITPSQLESKLRGLSQKPAAVYITSPDYLGNVADIKGLSEIAHSFGVPLIVDNAHGAYLKFLSPSRHPIDLGADMCCDSAHKTLPVITGGAYLHVSECAPKTFISQAKRAMAMFGSTSPSYLILQSLDLANKYIFDCMIPKLDSFAEKTEKLKKDLEDAGYTLVGSEELKITVNMKKRGCDGKKVQSFLEENGIVCEYADRDFVVFMLSMLNSETDLERLRRALLSLPQKDELTDAFPKFSPPDRAMSIRNAAMSECEMVSVSQSVGRVLAATSVFCPPAVPIAVCGEIISRDMARCFEYYGIKEVSVTSK